LSEASDAPQAAGQYVDHQPFKFKKSRGEKEKIDKQRTSLNAGGQTEIEHVQQSGLALQASKPPPP